MNASSVPTAALRDGAQRSTSGDTATRQGLVSVAWFVGLSLGLGVIALGARVPVATLPFVLAIGPTAIAVLLAWREGHGAVRELARSVTIRPADHRWYLVLAIPVAWSLATVITAVALGAPTTGLFDRLLPAVLIVPLVVLVPAFAEELAWRGFALTRLLRGMSPLKASLLLAIPWTLIHALLFLPGQWYGDLAAWPMAISIFSYSILLTWIFIGTGGSVFMTALFHAGLNGVAPIMGGLDADTAWVIRNIIAAMIAITLVALGGLRRVETPD